MITADVSTSKHATNFARTRKYSLTKTKNQSQKPKFIIMFLINHATVIRGILQGIPMSSSGHKE